MAKCYLILNNQRNNKQLENMTRKFEKTEDFANYLSDKGYKMLSVNRPNQNGCFAIVIGKPNIKDFTQIQDIGQNAWEVRLSVKDYANESIIG